MPSRPVGRLLDLEYRILQACLDLQAASEPVYGFALAQRMSGADGDQGLVGHGTLYKALGRLSKMGLLESNWEVPGDEDQGRPRRRLYRVTGEGARVVDDMDALECLRAAKAKSASRIVVAEKALKDWAASDFVAVMDPEAGWATNVLGPTEFGHLGALKQDFPKSCTQAGIYGAPGY